MAVKISYENLQIISTLHNEDRFAKALKEFLKEEKSTYYFYGYNPINAKSIEIKFFQLLQIMAHIDSRRYPSLYDTLNSIFISAEISNQKSIFLYGRTNHE